LLLEHDGARRADQVVSQLRDDPALALWTLCMANHSGADPRTLEALARWLREHVANQPATSRLLIWDAADEASDSEEKTGEASWRDEARRLTVAAHRIAAAAYQRALETPDAQPDEVLLVALLHDPIGWFSMETFGGVSEGEPPLPAWLERELAVATTAANTSPSSGAGCLAVALDEMRQAENNDGTASEIPLAPKDIWLESRKSWVCLLPRLARRLARLDDLEHHFDEQLEVEKLEAMAELAAGAGHEINNPLAVISGRAQLMLRDEHDPGRRRTLGSIHAQALRVHEMISDLMLFARPPRMEPDAVDLNQLLNELTTRLTAVVEPRRIGVTLRVPERQLCVEGDSVQLTVALKAITDNAVEAIGEGGQIHIETRAIESPIPDSPESLGQIEIIIRDDGPGIAPEIRRHLFDPFYSGRSAGRGLGFGLTKCWRIVTAHGGQIDVTSNPGSGTEFRVTLPEGASSASRAVISGKTP